MEVGMSSFLEKAAENAIFLAEFLGIVLAIFLLAYLVERKVAKERGIDGKLLTTKKLSMIGLFSALSVILMFFEIPLPFAPPFYKIDFSEVPVLIVTFAFGPVAGVLTEFCKILLKLVFKSTSTAFVGELANFIIGCSMILPASFVYLYRKSKGFAIGGCVLGTICMSVFGTMFNAVYLIPKFAQLYGMPLESIIAMGTAVNPAINSLYSLVLLAVFPFNIVKGVSVSVFTLILYKKLSLILRAEPGRPAPVKIK